jgi:hypothetical protein
MKRNGYFKFACRQDGFYITVYPPVDGGKPATTDDLLTYINKKGLNDYVDVLAVKNLFGKNESKSLRLSEVTPIPNSEYGVYTIASDNMRVEAVFYPPFDGADVLSADEIKSDLAAIGVKAGIDDEQINAFLENHNYFEPFIVAKGTDPIEGHDGRIEYKFNTEPVKAPKVKPDGTVDFHELDNVNHIKNGEVLAELFPEDLGTPGVDVKGKTVYPHKVKRVMFKYGRNMHVSNDGRQLISEVSGHVSLENDKVFVSNTLEVVDVDNSTGNINYNGGVLVKGNVLAGFSVEATGDITVEGLVEGAILKAGGNITLVRGVQGGGKAILKAGGNIVTKFIEGAENVSAGGTIETDSILHSKVVAKGAITVKGRNGLIVGGDVKSTVLIDCMTIGNEMGTTTVVGVGVDPTVKKRIDVLKHELEEMGKQKLQLSQVVTVLRKRQDEEGKLSPDKQSLQQKTMRQMILLEQKITTNKKELEDLRGMISEDSNARIKVAKTAYVGTKLMFGDQYLFLRKKYDYCQFVKREGDIGSTGM